MPGYRIGIDVGGTFTHGVVLQPPGEVIATARTPTTHRAEYGVADGVRETLAQLLAVMAERGLDKGAIELVAHSTTQATNALLEGDVSPILRLVVVPPGEGPLCRTALKGRQLDIGNGHHLPLATRWLDWNTARDAEKLSASLADEETRLPTAVIQPLAGSQENLESAVADVYRRQGFTTVCASAITEVLGLAARARTAAVNASMLPTMLTTADYTAQAIHELLPKVPVQVVRSDGGAMSLAEMRRQPILSLLSGPAAGASAALDMSGLSEVVFIEVGGTSTDITLIKEGRVRHRYATVGGQRLMVPALDLRTVAVGGGSILRADYSSCGPRSAHIAGLPYLFSALNEGERVTGFEDWRDPLSGEAYRVARLVGGELAAITATDLWLMQCDNEDEIAASGITRADDVYRQISELLGRENYARLTDARSRTAIDNTAQLVTNAIHDLAASHEAHLGHFALLAGGGGAPVYCDAVGRATGTASCSTIAHNAVISAIGAALAVTCVSLSRTVADPGGADIAALTTEVEDRLREQGSERVSTDVEYDQHRQVLTVTGRGSRAYEADLAGETGFFTDSVFSTDKPQVAWESNEARLLVDPRPTGKKRQACAVNRRGRMLWIGYVKEWFPVEAGQLMPALNRIVESRTAFTDGGPALPGLALICAGRFVPLEQLGSRELIAEVIRWENLPDGAPACFLLRS
ncbi:hypothetical protein JW859_05230 [bacterium]|nr:hypothetical protein [bacterium]